MSGWRPALRIARRDALRHKGRTLLVAVLVGLPVAGATFVDVMYRSEQLEPRDVVAVSLGPAQQASLQAPTPGTPLAQDPLNDNRWQADSGSGSDGQPGTSRPGAVQPDGSTSAALTARVRALLPAGDRASAVSVFYGNARFTAPSGPLSASVIEAATDVRGVIPDLSVVSGALPSSAGEVAVGRRVADRHHLTLGTTLHLIGGASTGLQTRDVVVTGILAAPPGRNVETLTAVLGLPGALLDASPAEMGTSWVVTGPQPLTWDDVLRLNHAGFTALSRHVLLDPPDPAAVPFNSLPSLDAGPSSTVVGVAAVAVLLVLLQVALLAGPALAVGARNNTHTLALAAAAGGTRRHLRLVVLGGGLVAGLAGAAGGAALGVAVAWPLHTWLLSRGDVTGPRVDVHALDLLGLVAVGTLTAVAAAWFPARQAARTDVVAALTGRRGQAAPRLRVPLLGVVVLAGGVALGVWAATTYHPVPLSIAIAVGEIGLILTMGTVVAVAARLARRAPLPLRLALRDAARQRGRTIPAVSAVMAAVAGLVCAGIYVATQDRYEVLGYEPTTALGVVVVQSSQGSASQQETPGLDGVRQTLLALPGARTVQPLRAALPPTGRSVFSPPAPGRECPGPGHDDDPRCGVYLRPSDSLAVSAYPGVFVDDTGDTTAVLRGQDDPAVRAALSAGRAVTWDPNAVAPDGRMRLQLQDDNGAVTRTVTVPAALATSRPVMNGPVLTSRAATALGLPVVQTGWTTHPDVPLTPEQVNLLDDRLQSTGDWTAGVETGPVSRIGVVLWSLLGAALVVALAGTFTAVGLARVEGRADASTLAAVGAAPAVRRRLAAAQAMTIAGIGTLLGAAAGLGAGWGLVRLRQGPQQGAAAVSGNGGTPVSVGPSQAVWQLTIPWPELVAGTVGLVVLAVLIAFVTTRSRLTLVRRIS